MRASGAVQSNNIIILCLGTKAEGADLLMRRDTEARRRADVSGRKMGRVLRICPSYNISPSHMGRERVSLECNPEWHHLRLVVQPHEPGTCFFFTCKAHEDSDSAKSWWIDSMG